VDVIGNLYDSSISFTASSAYKIFAVLCFSTSHTTHRSTTTFPHQTHHYQQQTTSNHLQSKSKQPLNDMVRNERGHELDYPRPIPLTGYRRPTSITAYGRGPQREYSHSMGGNQFYGNQFENQDPGYSYRGQEGPRGRVAPYNLGQALGIARARRRPRRR